MIPEGELFQFEARNPLPRFTRRKIGDVFALNVEIEEALWEEIKLMPRGAILSGKLYWSLGDDAKLIEKADRKLGGEAKGEFGRWWELLCKRGLLNSLDLRQVLDCDACGPAETKQALYEKFGVKSLSAIPPSDFARWAASEKLNAIVMMAAEVINEMETV